MPILQNQRHERFAQEVAIGKSATEAYESAGYKPSSGNACSLKANQSVKDRIAELQAEKTGKIIEKAAISRVWVLGMLRENAERAMQHEPVRSSDGEETGEYVYNGSVANRALELIGKEIGLFIERHEHGQAGDFDKLSDKDLLLHISQTAQLLIENQSDKAEE